MELRPLGRTGVQVSKLCLGTMMFGDWGTKDHDESITIIHRALDAGINFVDTADASCSPRNSSCHPTTTRTTAAARAAGS